MSDPRYAPRDPEDLARDRVRHALFGTFQKTTHGWGILREPTWEEKAHALEIVDGLIQEVASQERTIGRLGEDVG